MRFDSHLSPEGRAARLAAEENQAKVASKAAEAYKELGKVADFVLRFHSTKGAKVTRSKKEEMGSLVLEAAKVLRKASEDSGDSGYWVEAEEITGESESTIDAYRTFRRVLFGKWSDLDEDSSIRAMSVDFLTNVDYRESHQKNWMVG